ncbi:MAG: hypothetical protein MZV63_72575 [Marinilabiliales bacterium]|nr:hypothetical protein [Marinilabiliales bacterium]
MPSTWMEFAVEGDAFHVQQAAHHFDGLAHGESAAFGVRCPRSWPAGPTMRRCRR